MGEACYPVAFLPVFRYFGTYLFNGAGKVAADGMAGDGEVVNVLPACALVDTTFFNTRGGNGSYQSVGFNATALTFTST